MLGPLNDYFLNLRTFKDITVGNCRHHLLCTNCTNCHSHDDMTHSRPAYLLLLVHAHLP